MDWAETGFFRGLWYTSYVNVQPEVAGKRDQATTTNMLAVLRGPLKQEIANGPTLQPGSVG
jgi:hypothetical protein